MRSLYLEQRTWLHRVRAGTKLGVLAAAGTLLALTDRVPLLGAAALASALLYLSLGRAAWGRAAMLRGLLLACGLILAFHWFSGTPRLGCASALRLASAGILALMLTLTTTFQDLLQVLERLLLPLQRFGLPAQRLALGLGLVLRFAEDFHAQWQRLNDAHRARTGRAGGLRLLAPLIIRALTTAERVAEALAARLGR